MYYYQREAIVVASCFDNREIIILKYKTKLPHRTFVSKLHFCRTFSKNVIVALSLTNERLTSCFLLITKLYTRKRKK